MEAPGPASALIHAATIDSAAVFLMVRAFPIFAVVEGSAQMASVGLIGAFTAVFASAIAIAQRDIKRVLAYSTISQLGYIVAALGIGAYVAGHAFFKALLFLGAGSVIQGMERGHHHRMLSIRVHGEGDGGGHGEFSPRDMLNMGGLAKRMPTTFWTFIIGGLALSGLPLVTAGFWSKDRILAHAWEVQEIFWALAISASFTAFYTMRQISLTFFGQPRTREAALARESAPSMIVPLIVLSIFALGLGWVGVAEDFPAIGGWIPDWAHHFVISTVEPIEEVEPPAIAPEIVLQFEVIPLVAGVILELGGLALGWLVYGRRPMQSGGVDRVWAAMRLGRLGWLYQALRQRFYVDELYQATFVRASILLADLFYAFDHDVIDGLVNLIGRAGRAASRVSDLFDLHVVDRLVNGVGDAVKGAGRLIRPTQTGRVQNYLLLVSLTVKVLIVTFFVILFLQI
jgi:NADH-quinone oxidoreductase subunit L